MQKNRIRPITVCFRCNSPDKVQRVRKIISNGREQIIDYCHRCKCNAGKTHIIGRMEVLNPDRLPVLSDATKNAPVCAVCGATGAENHHWAPRHIFGQEADGWPQSWLCPVCHNEWHDKVEGNKRWNKYQ
jgi:hypothetical protein